MHQHGSDTVDTSFLNIELSDGSTSNKLSLEATDGHTEPERNAQEDSSRGLFRHALAFAADHFRCLRWQLASENQANSSLVIPISLGTVYVRATF